MGMDDSVLSNLWLFIFFVAFNMCSRTITFAVVLRPMIKQLKQLDKWHRSGINEAALYRGEADRNLDGVFQQKGAER
jgi:hypothetical protein